MKFLQAAIEDQAVVVRLISIDRGRKVVHPGLDELLPEHLDDASYGFPGPKALPHLIKELIAVDELVGPTPQPFQEPERKRVAQDTGFPVPMDREGG